MKWAIGTLVLVLVLLAVGVFMTNSVLAPVENDTPYARDIYGTTADNGKPEPLVEIYDGISVSKDVTKLDLSGRNLTGSLKAEVRHLSQLEELNLSDNQFTGLPAEVGQLSELRIIDLSNNQFTGLPHELGNLKQLKTLNVSGNETSGFDLEVITGALPALQVISEISVPIKEAEKDVGDISETEEETDEPVACTMDAKICPDGSAVGRVGPNCEFAPCPE